MTARELRFEVSAADTSVSALLVRPPAAKILYVLGHGAGAGMRHAFLERLAALLAERHIATFRYQFPYMEAGSRRPDSRRILYDTVRSAVRAVAQSAPGLPLIAGGKSMGGRMTSLVQSVEPLPGVLGLAFVGFPLHPPRKPGTERAEHLSDVAVPMLFLQGTRDTLADLALLTPIVGALGELATMHVVEGGDHSFKVLKRSGRTEDDVFAELVDVLDAWSADLV